MEKYGSQLNNMQSTSVTKVIDLLYSQEGIAPAMAKFVALVVERQGDLIAIEIIDELTKQIFLSDASYESVGMKNISKFLQKLSKLAAKTLYKNISTLLPLFDCENYLLRQAIIKIIKNIIIYVLHQPSDLVQDENGEIDHRQMQESVEVYYQTKLQFFDILLRRFLDKSSFCRGKIIKTFSKLTEENIVPRHLYIDLFAAVVGRLKDQSVNCRKNALKLLQQLVYLFSIFYGVKAGENEKFPDQDKAAQDLE